jgi:guanylate kinase
MALGAAASYPSATLTHPSESNPQPGPARVSAQATAARGRLFVIAAPSGAGKTSLVKALMERDPGLRFSVSYTTRPPRATEVEGRDYHFVDAGRFAEMVARDEFLEHARVFDNAYGTALATVQQALERGERLLLEIDWQGARQVRQRLPEAVSIFILPPSRASLEDRLRQRSTDSDDIIRRRLRDSVHDLSHWDEFDYVVVNDRFDQALGELQAIVAGRGEAWRRDRPEVARLTTELLADA